MKADIRILTFVHCFSRSIQSQIRIADRPPLSGQKFNPTFAWTGWIKPKHLHAYLQWNLFITQTLADWSQPRTLHRLRVVPHRSEFWRFEPGQPPRQWTLRVYQSLVDRWRKTCSMRSGSRRIKPSSEYLNRAKIRNWIG